MGATREPSLGASPPARPPLHGRPRALHRDPGDHAVAHRLRRHWFAATEGTEPGVNREEVLPEGGEAVPGETVGLSSGEATLGLFHSGEGLVKIPAKAALQGLLH